jgi:pimeloyl-ACP methyl ester carboxylesterase
MSDRPKKAEDFIVPLNINGLQGRMLRLPAQKKRQSEILLIYGSHSSLERWWGLAQELNKLAAVTMPDLPGLGGMTPLYSIGRVPDIDSMAEYLATFVKLKYRNKKVSIAGMSLGFVVVTRMLQKYPELAKKVEFLISIVGFAHKDDFIFSPRRKRIYRFCSKLLSRKWSSRIFRYTALQPFFLNLAYHHTHNAKKKFAEISGDEFRRTMDMEIHLWDINDIRTQFKHYVEMFDLDNTQTKVNLPVYHVAAKKDRYFDNVRVEEHMRRTFNDFTVFYMRSHNHAPTIVATTEDAAPYAPDGIRKLFKKRRKV